MTNALPRNVILAGFMGSGKTTVGKLLAARLGWQFVDTDELIERRAGRAVAEIFRAQGEAAFRQWESEVAEGLATMERCVIATGGGFMLRPENRAAAEAAGMVVFLMASPEEIWHRVRGGAGRPLLEGEDPRRRIRELLDQRQAAYQALPICIDTDRRTPEAVAEAIWARLVSG